MKNELQRAFEVIGLLLFCAPWRVSAQHDHDLALAQSESSSAQINMLSHGTSTRSERAQILFDQGLNLIYAFNHNMAIASFRLAIDHDPGFAMAYWGIALAESANINSPVTTERATRAIAALAQAQALAVHANERDRAYIAALQERYSGSPEDPRPPQDRAYAAAMERLALRFPDDPTAWTLHADALMNLTPWVHWGSNGNPLPDTPAILRSLETAKARDPQHIGANHYYIHAVEASPHPARALPSALRLSELGLKAGHLVHMPSHIYFRLGDHARVVEANERAALADEELFRANSKEDRAYRGYYAHNLDFLVVGYSYLGNFSAAMQSAKRLDAVIDEFVRTAPKAEHLFTRRMGALLRFGKWNDILHIPQPHRDQQVRLAYWHYARATALVNQGNLRGASAERAAFVRTSQAIPRAAQVGNNSTTELLAIASKLIDGRIAMASGNDRQAIAHLRQAVELQDALAYDEPPNWHYPTRETLGAALLALGEPTEAEAVFREDLRRNHLNPRSLFGLSESLKQQGRSDEYRIVKEQFARSWQYADSLIDLSHF